MNKLTGYKIIRGNYMNITMLTDFYELTMAQGYFKTGEGSKNAVFDLFYRNNPNNGGYSICAGLSQVIDYIQNICFTNEDIEYLRKFSIFDSDFLEYLKKFRFSGDIYAVPEGTVIFPEEPILRVRAPIIEAQFIETALLNIINHQSLIATKASRLVWAGRGDKILEFGLRRAQGTAAGLYGARAAVIGGCFATSNVLAGKMFDIPVRGTHAHSWVMSFEDELTAFRKYAEIFPDNCILLADTFDTLHSGVPNAIKVFSELREKGELSDGYGIRIDSGDFAYISEKARETLDNAGFNDAVICASSDLDEYIIASLKQQETKINVWGVGTNLITSKDCPAFGGVYKLSAKEKDGKLLPKIKISENPNKITNPGIKKVLRLYDKSTKKIKADLIALEHEMINEGKDLTIFSPLATWKTMTLKAGDFLVRELLTPVFIKGELVYRDIPVMEIRDYREGEMDSLWPEYKRLVNPHILPVDLSEELFRLKRNLINQTLHKF